MPVFFFILTDFHGSLSKNWYCLSKTEAESEAIEFAKVSGLDVVTVCPSLVLGPMLQPTVNSSSLVLIKLLKGNFLSRTYIVIPSSRTSIFIHANPIFSI